MPSLLMLAYYYPPANAAGAARPFRFRKYLQKLGGWQVHVVAADEAPDGSVSARHVPERPSIGPHPRRLTRWAELTQRHVLPYNEGLPWAPHAVSEASAIIQQQNCKAIYSTSPPTATHLAALWLKKRYRLPWIADFRDPLRGNVSRSRPFAKGYDMLLERTILTNADAAIANTCEVGEIWRERYPGLSGKISVLYNGFDPEEEVVALPIPDRTRRVMTHAGAIYAGRHPGLLLESVERLVSNGRLDPSAILIRLIGDLDRGSFPKAELIDVLHSRGCLEYTGKTLPKEEADGAVASSDYILLLDSNAYQTSVQVPSKLFTSIRLGRFILALTPPKSPTERILSQSGVPNECIANDWAPERVDERVGFVFTQPAQSAVEPSPWFQEHFNAVNQTEALLSILEGLRR